MFVAIIFYCNENSDPKSLNKIIELKQTGPKSFFYIPNLFI